MSFLFWSLGLVAAGLFFLKEYFSKPSGRVAIRAWRFGTAAALLVFVGLALQFPDAGDSTTIEGQAIQDSTMSQLLHKSDSALDRTDSVLCIVKDIVASMHESEDKDIQQRLELRLKTIRENAITSSLSSIGLGSLDEAIAHITYAIDAATTDSTIGEAYMGKALIYQVYADSVAGQVDADSTNLLWSKVVLYWDSTLHYYDRDMDWFLKGHALSKLGDYEEAIECYGKDLDQNPDLIDKCNLWSHMGVALCAIGDDVLAVEYFDSAIAYSDPKSALYDSKAKSLAEMGKYTQALAAANSSIEIDSGRGNSWFYKGVSLMGIGSDSSDLRQRTVPVEVYESAVLCFDRALALGADGGQTWLMRACSLARLSRYSEAIISCDSAIDNGIDSSVVLALREVLRFASARR